MIFRFDVTNHGVQEEGFFNKTFSYLEQNIPDIE